MSRPIQIVERARADGDHIFNWLTRRSVQGAISWYMAFHRAVEKVATSPEMFGEAPESHQLSRTLRQVPFKTRRGRVYRVVFELTDREIIIVRVRGPGQPPLRSKDLPQ